MKMFKRLMLLVVIAGLIVAWTQSSESTKRYIIHIGKQVPSLPYRYFV